MLDDLQRRDGGVHARRRGGGSACRHLRVPADQPPARLPGVRQGRRVPAPGFLLQLRTRRKPDGLPASRVRWRRREGGCGLRPDADAEPQPLHPVHALRAVHARGGRRRADRHHQSRRRQRDRDLPRAGRAFAALGQPDGRVPGRRDHHPRLPIQEPALGQPQRRRYHLHAVLQGVQHQRLDQGEAGMGERHAAGSHDAAVQPGGQQLLDVRSSGASTSAGWKATTGCASRCSARADR